MISCLVEILIGYSGQSFKLSFGSPHTIVSQQRIQRVVKFSKNKVLGHLDGLYILLAEVKFLVFLNGWYQSSRLSSTECCLRVLKEVDPVVHGPGGGKVSDLATVEEETGSHVE